MTRSIFIGVIALALTASVAQAADAKAEVDFVTRASVGNLAAIAESRLALDRTGNAEVKAFAGRLIDDHEKAETALRAAAAGSGAEVPAALDRDHQARLTALQGRSGADFDKAYVADQAEVHSNALTLYADYMLLGDNARLKALAIAMIPVAQAEFTSAQALTTH